MLPDASPGPAPGSTAGVVWKRGAEGQVPGSNRAMRARAAEGCGWQRERETANRYAAGKVDKRRCAGQRAGRANAAPAAPLSSTCTEASRREGQSWPSIAGGLPPALAGIHAPECLSSHVHWPAGTMATCPLSASCLLPPPPPGATPPPTLHSLQGWVDPSPLGLSLRPSQTTPSSRPPHPTSSGCLGSPAVCP